MAALVADRQAYRSNKWRHSHWCRKPQAHRGRHQCGSCRYSWTQGQRAIVVCLELAWARREKAVAPDPAASAAQVTAIRSNVSQQDRDAGTPGRSRLTQ